MGDNTTTTTTQPIVQSSSPYPGSIPHIDAIMGTGAGLYYGNVGGEISPYGANAPLNTDYASSLSSLLGYYNNPSLYQSASLPYTTALNQTVTGGADQYAPAQNFYQNVGNFSWGTPSAAEQNLSGMAANGTTNPFLNQLLDTNAERIGNQVASRFSGAGRYGSSGFADALNRSIAETNNPILFQAGESQANRQLQANNAIDAAINQRMGRVMGAGQGLGTIAQNVTGNQRAWAQMAPQLYQAGAAPWLGAMNVGNILQARDQAELENTKEKWQQATLMPWTQLARYQGAITNLAGILSNARINTTSPQVQTQSTPTPWTSLAGLGIAGAGLLSGSDIRLKTNIVYLGEELGLSIYEYSYKADHSGKRRRGPMAQEVLLKYPNLVTNVGGILYLKAG